MAERRKPSRWRRAGRPDVGGPGEARSAGGKAPGENPYVGARPFEASESALFFGRTREQRKLAALIIARRSVLLYAQSGAGKTSLVQAGLVPHLQETEGTEVLPLGRVGGDLPPGVKGARVGNIYVFNTLLNMLGEKARPQEMLDLSLSQGLETYFGLNSGAEQPVLLVLDQFEELFTSHSDRYPERASFFHQLRASLKEYAYLSLLLALREDYLAQFDAYAALMPDRLRARFRMERLGYSAALSAVKEPAQRAGRSFESGVAEALVSNLAGLQDRAREDGEREAADNSTAPLPQDPDAAGVYVEPVHLQIVCQQLWDKVPAAQKQIRAEDVERFGDVDQALAGLYKEALDEVIEKTDIGERQLRAWFAPPLITPAGTRGLVYRDEGKGETEELPNQAVDLLYDAYLIRPVKRGDDTWYELAHDRLVAPILEANRAWELEQAKQRPPEILSFEVDPWLIMEGQEVTLTWQAEGADALTLQPLDEEVPLSGSMSVTPAGTMEYWLEANKGGARVAESRRREVWVSELSPGFWGGLAKVIELDRVVPVIGSSFAYDHIFGNRPNLVQAWADELGVSVGDQADPAQVAQLVDHRHNYLFTRSSYLDFLKSSAWQSYEGATGKPPREMQEEWRGLSFSQFLRGLDYLDRLGNEAKDAFALLAKLPFTVYLTTSYHEVMEDALKREDKQPRSLFFPWNEDSYYSDLGVVPDFHPSEKEPAVYHLSGLDAEPDSLVLSEDDHLDLLIQFKGDEMRGASSKIPGWLQKKIAMDGLILLGFEQQNWEFKAVWNIIGRTVSAISWRRPSCIFQSAAHGKSRESARYLEEYLTARLPLQVYWGDPASFVKDLWQAWQSSR